MATLKELKKNYSLAFGTKKADEVFLELERYEATMPAGITINVVQGLLHYAVRTSYVNPLGTQVRVALGTFTSFATAVTTLFNWKIERALKDVNPELTKTVVAQLKQMNSKSVGSAVHEVIMPLKAGGIDEITRNNYFTILSAMPPFMIPTEGDYNVESPFDGVMTHIPAGIIADWFVVEQAKADSFVAERYHQTIGTERLPTVESEFTYEADNEDAPDSEAIQANAEAFFGKL